MTTFTNSLACEKLYLKCIFLLKMYIHSITLPLGKQSSSDAKSHYAANNQDNITLRSTHNSTSENSNSHSHKRKVSLLVNSLNDSSKYSQKNQRSLRNKKVNIEIIITNSCMPGFVYLNIKRCCSNKTPNP